MALTERQMSSSDGIRTLTIQRPETTLIETLTLGNGIAYSTDVPDTVAPDLKSPNSSSSHVGAILSGVAAILFLLSIAWFCGRKGRTHPRGSGGSSRQSDSGISLSSRSSNGSSSDGDPGSAASDVTEEQWEQPAQPMPGIPHPVARQWAAPSSEFVGSLSGTGPPGGVGMGMSAGRGGILPMKGRGGGRPPMYGGRTPPIVPIVGSGGPPQ